MLVMIIENVPSSLRGEMNKWMLEPKSGVFVGKVSSLVKDKLWEKCISKVPTGSFVQIWKSNNEQGFSIRTHGDRKRSIIDFEGLFLIKIKEDM